MNEQSIFLAALEFADPTQRADYLNQACAEQPALRRQVDALLAAHERSGEFLDVPALRQMAAGTERNGDSFDETSAELHVSPREIDLAFLEPSTTSDSIGRLKHYAIHQVIGRGGCGIVLKAFDEKLHRIVAIKVMAPALAATSPARKRFLREARATAAIRHENVISVYAVEEQPLPFLVMEYIDGQTLQQKLDQHGPLDVREVLRIGQQIASGLEAAHAKGLIHRDIKPGNILLEDGTGHVKITDFGLARSVDDASMTQSGVICGTPLYMSPEQAQAHEIDHRSDLFSLGSVLYVMCSGRPPFRAATSIAVLRRVVDEQPRPIQGIIPEIPQWLTAIIAKLHAKNPEERFGSAKEAGELLARCQSELQLHGHVESLHDILQPLPQPEATAQEPKEDGHAGFVQKLAPAPDKPSASLNSHRWVAAAAMILVLLAGLGMSEATGVTNVRGTVVRLFSPEGTLVVEVDDPGVSVTIDGEELVITGTGAKEIRLRPGQYKVLASKDGKVVRRELVTVTSNGRQVVRVSLEAEPSRVASGGWRGWPADAPKPAIAPFDAAQAKRYQDEWAAYLKVPVEYTNSIGMKFRLIPPGEFLMGSTAAEIEEALKSPDPNIPQNIWHDFQKCTQSEAPQHRVVLTQPTYLGVYEVTQHEYTAVMKSNPSCFASTGSLKPLVAKVAGVDTALFPVEGMSWNSANDFCVKLGEQEKLSPTPAGYRLPTEAQWEYACRAGTTTKYWTGNNEKELERAGWCHTNSDGRTHNVGEREANPFGLYDIHGNVWEWVQDCWEPTYYSQVQGEPTLDPRGPSSTSSRHVNRGGSWWPSNFSQCRASQRFTYPLGSTIGFRVTLPIDTVRRSLNRSGPGTAKPSPDHADWVQIFNGPQRYKNSLGMEFALIPKGKAWLGGGGGKPGNKEVEFKDDFYLGVYEVTQEEWQKVMGSNPSHASRSGFNKALVKDISDADLKRFPVENVSWNDAQAFLEAINLHANETGWLYRLPTEDEWEYACRGGPMSSNLDSAFDFYVGKPSNELLHGQANIRDAKWLNRPCKVGSYSPNRLGLHDMHGNVGEVCHDALKDNKGAVVRSHRCGTWWVGSFYARASHRHLAPESFKEGHDGLRLARVRAIDPPTTGTSTLAAGERKALEWVLSHGGILTLSANGEERVYREGDRLPEQPFRVRQLDLSRTIALNKASLENLKMVPRIEGTVVLGPSADDTVFAQLASYPGIAGASHVGLSGSLVTDESLVHFAKFPNIYEMYLSNTSVSAKGVAHLSDLRTLGLYLNDCNKIDDEACAPIGSMPNLYWLSLQGTSITDAGLAKLTGCKKLSTVRVLRCKVSESGARKLAAALPRCKIEWDGGVIEPIVLAAPDRKAAEYVLSVGGTVQIDDQERKIVSATDLPDGPFRLTVVDLEGNRKVTEEGLAAFRGTTHLKNVMMPHASGITDDSLAHFSRNAELWGLNVYGAKLSAKGLKCFENCPALRVFFLGETSIDDEDMRFFGDFVGLPHVTAMMLSDTAVGDEGLANLKGAEHLMQLSLSNTRITDAGLKVFENHRNLLWVGLQGTDIGDGGLLHLRSCSGLLDLDIKKTKVTAAGVEAFRQALPKCKIHWDGGVIEPTSSSASSQDVKAATKSRSGSVKD